jgi:hypothetical protein
MTEEAKEAAIHAARKWDRLCAAAPEMLALVRYLAKWTSDDNHHLGNMPDKARDLLRRIDGEP